MKKVMAAMLAGMMMVSMVGCGAGSQTSADASDSAQTKESTDGKSTLTIWASGSDNVRQVFEALIDDFNKNSEYADQYQAELQFMLSGTGTQSMTDMLAAAYKAKQTNTDYDLVDLGGDDLSKVVSQIGEEAFVKLDKSKIPNAENVAAKSSLAADYVQPYRGTTVVLAYDSEKVPTPPKTMDELVQWMKENPGRFAYNAPGTGGAGDSFVRTSVYNYMPEEAITSDDPSWEDQWSEGFDFLNPSIRICISPVALRYTQAKTREHWIC